MKLDINILATGMFVIAPISLFCSQNGNGITLCIIFLVLGIICRWIGNGGLNPTVRIKKENWWEEHYKMCLGAQAANKDKLDATDDKIARENADYRTRIKNIPLPSEEEKEKIARSMGIITYKMQQDAKDSWNKIQYEKCRLMKEFEENTNWNEFGKGYNSFRLYVEASRKALEYHMDFYSVLKEQPWDKPLTTEEKLEANKWIKEYKERFLKEVNDYVENKKSMPTIDYHYKHGYNVQNRDFNIKYGFEKDVSAI